MRTEPTRTRMLPIIIGNAFESIDFTLYGFFATTIARQFFPPGNDQAAALAAAAAFGAAFVMRPIGAIAFGLIGDGWGRMTALMPATPHRPAAGTTSPTARRTRPDRSTYVVAPDLSLHPAGARAR